MQPTFICKFNNLLVKLSKTPANLLIFHSGNLRLEKGGRSAASPTYFAFFG